MKNKFHGVALRTSLIYAGIGGAWILLSGQVLFALVPDPEVRVQLEIYKGWMFVAVTALLLFVTLRSQLHRLGREAAAHKKLEDELRWKTAFLEAQVNSTPDGILVVDQRGGKILQNQRMIEQLKIPREIVENQDNTAQIQFIMNRVKNPEQFAERIAHLYSHPNEVSRDEVELKDGTILDRYSSPVIGKDGMHYGRIWIFHDISEHKRADEKLRESEAKFRSYIENSPLAIFVANGDGHFVDFNAAALKMLDCDATSLKNLRTVDIHPDEDRELVLQTHAILAAQKQVQGELRIKTGKGGVIWVLLHAVVIEGGLTMGFCQDITERKRTADLHLRLVTAVEQAAEAVIITDTTGKILFANPAFEAITGYSQREVVGRNPSILKSGKHDQAFYQKMWTVLANGEVWSGRLINKKKDGTLFEEEATISPVRDTNGRITNFVAVKRDVTREVTLENQFRQSQKMEAFGQLAGGVAHDFNNLLTVIQGNASLLLNPQLKPEDRSGCSRQIVQAAERAAGLTRQLLMFSRKHALQVATLDLNEVVVNMTKMLQRILGEDIALRAEYNPRLPVVSADAGMIEQVLLNLAVNSRDAMPRGGQLLISTSLENPGADSPQLPPGMSPGQYVCLKVTDTGCGIRPEVLPHIFEPFFTTKEVGKGTGLGLATVYGIVQQHHGWVAVTSEVGRGTTFHVYLPAAKGAPVKSEALTAPKLPRGSETILVAEDEPAVRSLVDNLLRRCGYTVLTAESGVAALAVWKGHRDKIQLLLTDMIMPDGMTGFDLAQRLRSEQPELKVIYTSGYSADIFGKDSTLIRDGHFLRKPYHPHQLAQTVRDCLDQQPDDG